MSTLKELMEEIKSPEYKQKRIEKHEKHLKEVTMDYQLGLYVGEYIVNRYLPTLSVDSIQSNHVIRVSEEEQDECDRLYNKYQDSLEDNGWKNGDSELFENWKEYRKVLEKKYLPQVLECVVNLLRIDDMKKFKEGLSDTLWNCDMCSYNINEDKMEVYNDLEIGFTFIKFQYDSTTNDEMKK